MSEMTGREARFQAEQIKWKADEELVYSIVKPVLDKHDPERLLSMGAPADEYEPEARVIAETIVREGSYRLKVEELGNILALVWHMKFSMWGDQISYHERFYILAAELKQLLPELNYGWAGAHSKDSSTPSS
jgi:hypothetical protein